MKFTNDSKFIILVSENIIEIRTTEHLNKASTMDVLTNDIEDQFTIDNEGRILIMYNKQQGKIYIRDMFTDEFAAIDAFSNQI